MNKVIFINRFQNEWTQTAFQKLRQENQERRRKEKFAGCGRIKFFRRSE